jgi:hypothetical protein
MIWIRRQIFYSHRFVKTRQFIQRKLPIALPYNYEIEVQKVLSFYSISNYDLYFNTATQ